MWYLIHVFSDNGYINVTMNSRSFHKLYGNLITHIGPSITHLFTHLTLVGSQWVGIFANG
jgi:hypothetical protein